MNQTPVAGSPLFALFMASLLGVAATTLTTPFLTAGPLLWFGMLVLSTAVFFSILWAVSAIIVQRVHVDPIGRRLRVLGREYPFSSLRHATRNQINQRLAVYLIYRFTLDDGRRFRIIAFGRPFRGLTSRGFELLRAMVDGSALAEPVGLTPQQQRARSTMQRNLGPTPVGREAILGDIDELHPTTSPTSPHFTHDDALVEAQIQQRAGALRRVRRVSGITTIVAVVVMLILATISPLVLDGVANWWGRRYLEPVGGAVTVIALAGAVTWMLAADAWVRRVRHLADAWWDAAEAATRERGLPRPYQDADAKGARRCWNAAGCVGIAGAAAAVAVLVTAWGDESVRDLLIPASVAVVPLGALGVFCWRRARRDSRRSAERMARRSGRHL